MRTFVIGIPGSGRTVTHEAESVKLMELRLDIGYKVLGEMVSGAAIAPALPDGLKHYTLMTSLLRDHGLELREWLAENGCVCRCGSVSPPDHTAASAGGGSNAESLNEIEN